MRKKVEIYIEELEETRLYTVGTTLSEVLEDISLNSKQTILGAMVNNKLKELTYEIYKPKTVRFIDITAPNGRRMYMRSLYFVLYKAVVDLFPNVSLRQEYAISNGVFYRITNKNFVLTAEDVERIKQQMHKIIAQNIPFIRKEIKTEDAIELFEKNSLKEKTDLLRTRGYLYTSVYYLDNTIDYYYGFLVPTTNILKVFDLQPYNKGMLLLGPNRENHKNPNERIDQVKMQKVFSEFKRRGKLLNISNIGDLNRQVLSGEISELIKISEALHEKKIAQIADKIRKYQRRIKIILISGPSSSGKTTFGKRLAIQLKVAGLNPVNLSLDNYFVNRERTPIDEHGEYDFESLMALDIEKFNSDLVELMNGNEIKLPKFSFETGQRFYDGETMKLAENQILVVEGIHALNPQLTPLINREAKYQIYISALTAISIDGHNRIQSTDNRLIRRLVRDYKYRSYKATDTLKRWQSVRRGEMQNIFPYQEEADAMFNSALSYELGVLKRYAEPMLQEVRPNQPEYEEATRLLKFLSYFLPIDDREIPPTSLMREFLGGSAFEY